MSSLTYFEEVRLLQFVCGFRIEVILCRKKEEKSIVSFVDTICSQFIMSGKQGFVFNFFAVF